MFNKAPEIHHHMHGPQNVTVTHGEKKVTVNEHKAPTDASIAYADEMKQRVRESIMSTLKTDNNVFSVKGMHFEDYAMAENVVIIEYTINGHKRSVEHRYSIYDMNSLDVTDKLINDLYKVLSEDIARNLLTRAMSDIMPDFITARERRLTSK